MIYYLISGGGSLSRSSPYSRVLHARGFQLEGNMLTIRLCNWSCIFMCLGPFLSPYSASRHVTTSRRINQHIPANEVLIFM